MQQFRKKPVVISAVEFRARNLLEILNLPGVIVTTLFESDEGDNTPLYATIPTLEGNMVARPGDWIIRGIRGELYPCRGDIFAATYDAVEED